MFSTPRREINRQHDMAKILDECDLIEMVNKLQNKLAANGRMLDISLPQIVVVGCQSGGKSSVLQSIIGREILPRGTGVVTRRPTIIQLHPNDEAYAIFLHKEREKFFDFEQVKQEILNETLRDPGPGGFTSKPITVKIYAPNVLKLTLVDLPGIIKNVVDDQPEESIEEVNNMILKYIEQPNSIILAVTPATQDIAISDALQIAKQVDPKRVRTLGVLTKLDLMDSGTHARAVLENKVLELERGYVGVLNRSQKDIDDGLDIAYSLQKEKKFFANHPAYSHMADRMGSSYLQKVLHVQLREHIKKTLPALKKELSQRLNMLRRDLRNFDNFIGFSSNGTNGAQIYLLKVLQLFKDDIQKKLFGHSEHMEMDNLTAGSIINFKLYTDLQKILTLPTTLTEEKLMTLIANEHGIRNFLSVPSLVLEAACCEILKQYQEPLENIVDNITSILMQAVEDSTTSIYLHPGLKSDLLHYIGEAVDKAAEETKDLLGKHLKAEMSYCNVYHWDYNSTLLESGLPCTPVKIWDSVSAGSSSNGSSGSEASLDGNEVDVSEEFVNKKLRGNDNAKSNSRNLLGIIKDYVQLIQKQVGDVSMKYIICFLVNGVSDYIKTELTARILMSSNFKSLIEESEQELAHRNEIMTTCADLEDALDAIQSF